MTSAACCDVVLADDEVAAEAGGAPAKWHAHYESKGLKLVSPGGGWTVKPEIRLQLKRVHDLARAAGGSIAQGLRQIVDRSR